MGLLDIFRQPLYIPATASGEQVDGVTGLWWQEPRTDLSSIVIDDVYGDIPELVNRENAMKVPPVVRARDLLVGSTSDLPLVDWARNPQTKQDERVEPQPSFLYRSDDVSPWHRNAMTFDDLYFHDCCLWMCERGTKQDGARFAPILNAWRVPITDWRVERMDDGRQRILVNERPVPSENVIYIPGPHGGNGLLSSAKDTIRGARAIERAWVARVRTPIPPTLFEQTEQEIADDADVQGLVTKWSSARGNPESTATAFVPFGLRAVFPPINDDSQMFIEGRNAVRLDIANFSNIPAGLLDGSTATASLTYTTTEGQKSSFHEQTLRFWTAPVEHRLSMDDIVPRGQRVRFDITYQTQQGPTGEAAED